MYVIEDGHPNASQGSLVGFSNYIYYNRIRVRRGTMMEHTHLLNFLIPTHATGCAKYCNYYANTLRMLFFITVAQSKLQRWRIFQYTLILRSCIFQYTIHNKNNGWVTCNPSYLYWYHRESCIPESCTP